MHARVTKIGMSVVALSALALPTVLAIAPAGAAPKAKPVIKNGSFTKPAHTGGVFEEGQKLGAWKVSSGNVDLNGDAYDLPPGLVANASSVDLNGFEAGALTQTIKTVPGQTYTLSYYLGGNPDGDPGVKTVSVDVAGGVTDTEEFDSTDSTPEDIGWVQESFAFTATAKKSTLTFASDTPDTDYGPLVTGIAAAPVTATD